MHDLFNAMMAASTFSWVATLLMAGVVCWFLKTVAGAGGLAILFGPFLVLGGLLSTYLFTSGAILLNGDKDTNAVTISALGILGAMLVLLGLYIIFARISEARSRARKVPDALPDPAPR